MHNYTKKYLRRAIVFTILSVLITIAPAIYYIVKSFISSTLIIQKCALAGSVMIAIIGSLFCLVSKTFTFRSRIWIFLLAALLCLDNFTTMIIVFAITQIVDELIITPIAKYNRHEYLTNKHIDKREKYD